MPSQCLTLLVLDAQPTTLDALSAAVQRSLPGSRVLVAPGPEAALPLAREEDPEAILVALRREADAGFALCRLWKADEWLEAIPIVMLSTAGDGEEELVLALEQGAEAVLSLPPGDGELTACLRAMARIKDANRRRGREKAALTALLMERTRQLEVELDQRREAERALRESESRYRTIFDESPIAIWEEDFSAVKNRLDALRAAGVTDFDAHFDRQPEEVAALAAMVRVVAVNRRSVELLGAGGGDGVDYDLNRYFNPDSLRAFQRELVALAAGATSFQLDVPIMDPRGQRRVMDLTLSVPPDHRSTLSRVLVCFTDITDRQLAEERLRESEERHRQLFEQMLDGFALHELICDGDGRPCDYRFLAVNPAFESLTGLKAENLVGRTVLELMPGTERHWIETYGRVVLTGEPVRFSDYSAALDKHFEVASFRPAPGRFACLIRDITAFRRLEATLREAEQRFRSLFERHHACMLLIEPRSGAIVDANAAASRFYQYSLATLRQMNIADLNNLPAPEVEEARLRAASEQANRFIFPHRLADGEERIVEVHSTPISFSDQRLLFSIIHDVTEQKAAEEALRFTQFVMEHAADCIFWVQETGRIAYANVAACHRLGYTAEEIQRLDVTDVTAGYSLDRWPAHWAELKRCGALCFETEHRTRDGTVFPVEIRANYMAFGGREFNCAFVRDLTERRLLECERAALEAQARQRQKLESLGTLASGVAHEISNPINGAINYAQLILDLTPPDSRVAGHAREILRETSRVADIVLNLQRFSRPDSRTPSLVRPADLVESTLSLIRAVLRRDQITLEVEVPADLPAIRCHQQQIQQVLMNLITNARDALNERFPGHAEDKVLRIEVRVCRETDTSWLRLTATDHGTGITPAVRDRLFDPFFTTKGRDRGTGLGLSTSHEIVRQHGGRWTIESEPGRFTRMHVDLPIPDPAPPAVVEKPTPA